MNVEQIIQLLYRALEQRTQRLELVETLVRAVSDHREKEPQWEVLRDLAWDLSYYNPSEDDGAKDGAYYGDDRFDREVAEALLKLDEMKSPARRNGS